MWLLPVTFSLRYPSSRSATLRSLALTSNLYPETKVKPGPGSSQTFQSRSTLHSLRDLGVAASHIVPSRQTSLPNDHGHQPSINHDPIDLDVKSFTLKSYDDTDFESRRFSTQVTLAIMMFYLNSSKKSISFLPWFLSLKQFKVFVYIK